MPLQINLKLNNQMQREKYELIAQSQTDRQQCLGKIISYIFSDEYIHIDKTFRRFLNKDPKGYIHVDQLMTNQLLINFFESININQHNQKVFYIRGVIENQCSELHYSLGRVRRKVPFDMNKFKKLKPICIERIQNSLSIEDVRQIFEEHVFTSNKTIDRFVDEDILIYSQNYRTILPTFQERNLPFEIMNFEQYYKEYDLSQRLRERKLKSLCKPIEVPRQKLEDRARHNFRENMEEDYQCYRRDHREDMRNKQKNCVSDFIKYGRQPNPQFNKLLLPVLQREMNLE